MTYNCCGSCHAQTTTTSSATTHGHGTCTRLQGVTLPEVITHSVNESTARTHSCTSFPFQPSSLLFA
eukprot:6214822-Pleurochrysis_carterae.AAC.11